MLLSILVCSDFVLHSFTFLLRWEMQRIPLVSTSLSWQDKFCIPVNKRDSCKFCQWLKLKWTSLCCFRSCIINFVALWFFSGKLHMQLASEDPLKSQTAFLTPFSIPKNQWCHLVASYGDHVVRSEKLHSDISPLRIQPKRRRLHFYHGRACSL